MSTRGKKILQNFQINWIRLRDVDTGNVLWQDNEDLSVDAVERIVRIPKTIINCNSVLREINFSSVEPIRNFRLEQKAMYKGRTFEEWSFHYGFVIPNSVTTWQSLFFAAREAQLMPIEVLNGHVVIETMFFDGDELIAVSKIRLFYV